ncbi:hypothetical protein PC9H_000100 [Pleurotus ostreatus]|uniref:Uncharacterized protein n=1 Tax=Pleurotus ostreatus TaxID=5322 RepID=A0A8H7A2W8_PLEOS|nr:uncharacterized protein PC9H_000100 [Pleurotus ostreatus]KAF7439764.1 hypothetical protein PC9H_000100 [Pleurotus ostreatus]
MPNPDSFSDSDPSDTDVAAVDLSLPGPEASPGTLRKRLEDMQLQLAALVVDKDKAARENATLVAENMDKRGRAKKSVSMSIPDADDAKELGKKLAIMCEAWSDSNSFLKPRPDLHPNSEERYSTFETYKLGITSAIYDFLPKKYHSFLQSRNDWCSLLRRKQGEGRADALKYLKRAAPLIFKEYPIPASDWASPATRASSTIIQSLLKFPGDKKYPEVPPLVYPNLEASPKRVFCNPIIGRVLRVILFGFASLDKPTVHTSTLGKLWGINELTPASLAFAVIAAVFLLSPDSSLNETGLVSLIPYREYYYKLKGTLMLHADSAPIRKAFRIHQEIVFAGITYDSAASEAVNAAPEGQHGVSSLCEALRDIDSDDDDDETILHTGTRHVELETFDLSNVTESDGDEPADPPIDAAFAAPLEQPTLTTTPAAHDTPISANPKRGGNKKGRVGGRGRGTGRGANHAEVNQDVAPPRRVSGRTRAS